MPENYEADCLTSLRFADDVLLFATSMEQLQKMLCELKQSTEKVGLKIYLGKTKGPQRPNVKRKIEKCRLTTSQSGYYPRKKAQNIWDNQLHSSSKRQKKSRIVLGQLEHGSTNTGKN